MHTMMTDRRFRASLFGAFFCAGICASAVALQGAEEWEVVLRANIGSEYSKTRHDALVQVDTNSKAGLRAIWSVLDKIAPKDPLRYDWYVRQGAYEALSKAEGEEAEAEIDKVLAHKSYGNAKEAVIHSIIWKIREQFEQDRGGNDERKVEHYKELLRRSRGVEYFALVLPTLRKLDPEKKKLDWIHKAFGDRSSRVRLAAIEGMIAYPDKSSVELLIENLQKLEKKKSKSYKEWVFTRFALETLTGQYYRDDVKTWLKWWENAKSHFSIGKRVEDETDEEGKTKKKKRTKVVDAGGITVTLNMKVAGNGYPLLVLPSRGLDPDYFRPFFHGIEEFCRTYYVQMPLIQDFKGLARTKDSNLVIYPTEILAEALGKMMKDDGPEEFAILGHGPASSTLAMYIASKFPKRVSHLLMINPSPAGNVYGEAIQNVENEGRRRKNDEIVNGAKSIQIGQDGKPTYEAQDDAERGGNSRAIGNLHFADPTSPEISKRRYLYAISGDPQVMNDSKWSMQNIFGSRGPRLKTCVLVGEKDPWSPIRHVSKVATFFKAYTAKFKSSAQNPFMVETYRFTKEVEKFLGVAKKKKKSRPSKSR